MLKGRCGGGMWILSEHERGVLEVVFMGIYEYMLFEL